MMTVYRVGLVGVLLAVGLVGGCTKPAKSPYTGARVYLIEDTAGVNRDNLERLRVALDDHQINARTYTADNWLRIVKDIEKRPHQPVVLVGQGHGGFLAVEVVRHFAHPVYRKQIRMLITIDPCDKDGFDSPSIPIPDNIDYVYNVLTEPDGTASRGVELVSTRGTRVEKYGYEWRDLRVRTVEGQRLAMMTLRSDGKRASLGDDADLMNYVLDLCRKAVLNPYHWTPRSVHPYDEHPFIKGGMNPSGWPVEPT